MPLNGHAHDHDDATRIVDAARSAWQDHDPLPPRVQPLDLPAWHASRYAGTPPRLDWLVDHLIPLRAPGLVAALGGVGKSFLMLALARSVARGSGSFLGRAITCGQRASVVISFEDTAATIHRRLAAIDPEQSYTSLPLFVVPVPELAHRWSLATQIAGSALDETGAETLIRELDELRNSIQIPIGLVVVDPLQAAVAGDLTSAPEIAQAVCTILARIAAHTGATVIATHHVRKTDEISTIQDARAAIRGTTAIVDGVRFAIALWPASAETTQSIAQKLGAQNAKYGDIVHAAVVKSNEPCDTTIRTLQRDDRGLLVDVTDELEDVGLPTEDELRVLADAIGAAAAAGRPFRRRTRSEAGLAERRDELPEPIRSWSVRTIDRAVQIALDRGLIVAAAHKTGSARWLDVPTGPFARGEGRFAPGSGRAAQD